jgi:hypothetical protein
MDMAPVDETVASLHERQPAFDWVGVYVVDAVERAAEAIAARA